jgi:hypothetical protein
VQRLERIQVQRSGRLYQAVASVESSAWAGGSAARQVQPMTRLIAGYIGSQEASVTINGPTPLLLGGLKGTVPVSIDNRLRYPIQVRVRLRVTGLAGHKLTVSNPPGLIKVPAGVVQTVKLKVKATSVGSTTIALSLTTPQGQPLATTPVTITVQATQFGNLALIILAAALGVFMIASAARAIRRGRAGPGQSARGTPDVPRGGNGGLEPPKEADSVVADRTGPGGAYAGHARTEDADGYAWVPGWANRG